MLGASGRLSGNCFSLEQSIYIVGYIHTGQIGKGCGTYATARDMGRVVYTYIHISGEMGTYLRDGIRVAPIHNKGMLCSCR